MLVRSLLATGALVFGVAGANGASDGSNAADLFERTDCHSDCCKKCPPVYSYSTTTVYQPTTRTVTISETATKVDVTTETATKTLTETATTKTIETITDTATSKITIVETATEKFTITIPTTVIEEVTEVLTATATATATNILTNTLTLPGEVTTLPGSTYTTVVPTTLPGVTLTVTEDGTTTTIFVPGPTSYTTETFTLPPITVTITTKTGVTVCPAPTHHPKKRDVEVRTKKRRFARFGCDPGFVCNPPKPAGCNLWANSPDESYTCESKFCIRAPPLPRVKWARNRTSYYPPTEGYFNLNPNAFGLSFDIFDYDVVVKNENGKKVTVTTGNWVSQTDLTHWPPAATPTVITPPPACAEGSKCHGSKYNTGHKWSKRDETIAPPVCFADCNQAYNEGQRVGFVPELCVPPAPFLLLRDTCFECLVANGFDPRVSVREYFGDTLGLYLDYCDGQDPEPVTSTSSGTPPETVVTTIPSFTTTSQIPVSTETSFSPLPPTTTTTETTTSPPPETPTETSTVTPTETLTETPTESSTETSTSTDTPPPTPTDTPTDGSPTTTAPTNTSPASPSDTSASGSTTGSPTGSPAPPGGSPTPSGGTETATDSSATSPGGSPGPSASASGSSGGGGGGGGVPIPSDAPTGTSPPGTPGNDTSPSATTTSGRPPVATAAATRVMASASILALFLPVLALFY